MANGSDGNSSSWPRLTLNTSSQSSAQLLVLTGVTVALSAVTVLGNSLVLLSVKVNRRLRTVNNYFLLSLATADLLVGAVSVNVYALYAACGSWPLGAALCDLWLVVDHSVSAAAVLNLLLISLDRFFCLTRPLSYPLRRTGKTAALMIALAWLLSFSLWTPAILCWQGAGAERLVPEAECYPRLLASPVITLGTTLPAFFLPGVAMVGLYSHVSAASRQRLSARRRPPREQVGTSAFSLRGEATGDRSSSGRFKLGRSGGACASAGPSEWTALSLRPSHSASDYSARTRRHRAASAALSSAASTRHRGAVRERRVTRTILTILLTFILTRAPHNAMALVAAFCHVRIPDVLWQAGLWLVYVNSAVDPACYALCSPTFRSTFRRLLRCRCPDPPV
ncbi:muscarinic acetylcholine receptor M4-like [Syngnathus typhle]|uniref:muscarinic acetylcholine receptor M4-like n=1 Tax=Syngnathus typhle TaxID=161592 RepID=UPI002A6B4D51|nr:muscarinic acetylcholine receptor M4-like [Syngnathus typhle]XP_061138336.1 muscarinic acetylcholine receptor M4-like [Syngnathus typhle]